MTSADFGLVFVCFGLVCSEEPMKAVIEIVIEDSWNYVFLIV